MHKKPKAILLPLDTEIEKTLRNLRKVTSIESTRMENQRDRLQPIQDDAKLHRPQGKMMMEDF